jgi:hypothetical protein
MLNKPEVAMLESLIRRMTEKQRSGLAAWIIEELNAALAEDGCAGDASDDTHCHAKAH